MPKNSYVNRATDFDRVIGGRYFDESSAVEILISTAKDGNMDPRFSKSALRDFQTLLEKHLIDPAETFSPALGRNYRIITIDKGNEEKYAGRFIENGDLSGEYHCDAVIVFDATIPVAFRIGDCPVVLIVGNDPQGKKIMALVHAGRAELTAGMLKTTVAQMQSLYRIHLPSATAYVFPHICEYCYALKYMDPVTMDEGIDFVKVYAGQYHLDLFGWLTSQLNEAGIRRVVAAWFRCTAGISEHCVSSLLHKSKYFKGLFSHYKSFHRGLEEGRFVILVRIMDCDFDDDD